MNKYIDLVRCKNFPTVLIQKMSVLNLYTISSIYKKSLSDTV